jgi:hypothetical protein
LSVAENIDSPRTKKRGERQNSISRRRANSATCGTDTVTQVALLPVAYYTGDTFSPAPRRPAREITYFNRWKATI